MMIWFRMLPWARIKRWANVVLIVALWILVIFNSVVGNYARAGLDLGLLIMIRLGDIEKRLDETVLTVRLDELRQFSENKEN